MKCTNLLNNVLWWLKGHLDQFSVASGELEFYMHLAVHG